MMKKGLREALSRQRAWRIGLVIGVLASLAPAWGQEPAAPSGGQSTGATPNATVAAPAPAISPAASSDYVVTAEDLLDLYVMDVPELSRTYRVSAEGLLTLPLLPEPIHASGQSLDQLSHLIAAKFREAGMLNDAHVTVSLIETRLHTVLVSGKVRNPQAYPVFGPSRLLDLIVRAGGLTDDAGDEAVVTRGETGIRAEAQESARTGALDPSAHGATFTVNIRQMIQTGADKSDILVYPGDRVVVQRAEMVYILGAVVRPGGYVLSPSSDQMTVLKALAIAGDVTNVAKKSHITILRRTSDDLEAKRDEIPVNYKGMVKGEVADVRLKPDDILFIPESAGLKAWHTSVNSAVQVATYGGSALMVYR